MRTAEGCKLFGAYEAAAGVKDGLILLHSVVGCNFGTMSFHVFQDMTDIRQACTVISDDEVIFGGAESVAKALDLIGEKSCPSVVFVISGCVSGMIGDDLSAVLMERKDQFPVISIPAPGFCGGMEDGAREVYQAMFRIMKESAKRECVEKEEKDGDRIVPAVNIIGPGADDYRILQDKKMFQRLLGERIKIRLFTADCTYEDICRAPEASLNLVFGKGEELAKNMEETYGIPYVCLDYPYGLLGAKCLWNAVETYLPADFEERKSAEEKEVVSGLEKVFLYLQALYGSSAAVIAERSRAKGMKRFLSEELGMEVPICAVRDEIHDMKTVYDAVRAGEIAVLFASSFEADLADELNIPLVRIDYPVFDEICISDRPTIGGYGTLCLVEEMIREIMRARYRKGPLCQ